MLLRNLRKRPVGMQNIEAGPEIAAAIWVGNDVVVCARVVSLFLWVRNPFACMQHVAAMMLPDFILALRAAIVRGLCDALQIPRSIRVLRVLVPDQRRAVRRKLEREQSRAMRARHMIAPAVSAQRFLPNRACRNGWRAGKDVAMLEILARSLHHEIERSCLAFQQLRELVGLVADDSLV